MFNPKHKRRRTSRRAKARKRGGRRRGMPPALKAYWASKRKAKHGGRHMARRKRRSTRRHVRAHRRRRNPFAVRHVIRRVRRRHNPSLGGMGRGIVGTITKGAKCGAFVVLGESVSNIVPGLVKLPTTGIVGIAAKIAAGVAVGTVGRRVMGQENAAYFIAGVFAGVWRNLIKQFNVPLLAPALAGYGPALPGVVQPGLAGYAPRSGALPAAMRGSATGGGVYSF